MSQSATVKVFQDNLNHVFIETGTYRGGGIRLALKTGYKRIISIEINPEFYKKAIRDFIRIPNVALIYGDSGDILRDVLDPIMDKVTFWLDGHICQATKEYSRNDPIKDYPLMRELEIIKAHPRKDHTIMIDDWAAWTKTDMVDWGQEEVLKSVLSINPAYKITFEPNTNNDQIMVAKINR